MELKISSPCPKTWQDLQGDDRVRYCGDCKLNVYNFAAMGPEEIERVVRKTEGRLCGRLFLRGDRTATLRDCPKSRSRLLWRRTLAVASLLFLAGFAWIFRSMPGPDRSELPAWVRTIVEMIDPSPKTQPPRYELVGKICLPQKSVPPPTTD